MPGEAACNKRHAKTSDHRIGTNIRRVVRMICETFGVGDEEFGFANWYGDNSRVCLYLHVGRINTQGKAKQS